MSLNMQNILLILKKKFSLNLFFINLVLNIFNLINFTITINNYILFCAIAIDKEYQEINFY